MVQYFVLTAKFGIFVFDGVQTVRTRSHNLFGVDGVKRFYIHTGHFKEKVFIARPARGVAGAGFLIAQHGVVHARFVHNSGKGARRLLRAGVKGAGAANPVQHIKVRIFFNGGNFEVQRFRPGHAIIAHLPGIAIAFHSTEGGL